MSRARRTQRPRPCPCRTCRNPAAAAEMRELEAEVRAILAARR